MILHKYIHNAILKVETDTTLVSQRFMFLHHTEKNNFSIREHNIPQTSDPYTCMSSLLPR